MKTIVYLVRHAEAEGNISRRFHGQFDSNLTENGLRQALLLAKRFENEKVDIIYSSDLKRAYDTAKAVAEVKGLPVITDKKLREFSGGLWEDVEWDELPKRFPESFTAWEKEPHTAQIPGGESMIELQDRIKAAFYDIVSKNEGKNIAIFTHGTAIKVLFCHFHGIPIKNWDKLPWQDNTAVSLVEVAGNTVKIIYEGDNSHLGEYSTLAKQDWWKKAIDKS